MEKKYKVGGMACGGCSASVERALKALPGVENAKVDHITGIAVVRLKSMYPRLHARWNHLFSLNY